MQIIKSKLIDVLKWINDEVLLQMLAITGLYDKLKKTINHGLGL